ncbi:DMT family transporter [Natronincola ferrireducens]|uniref:Threonine/homoserine efflux transporter RhtA n=1 Tax=Natronincola ferrireducens TaxID=393762 RepID=A0A1G8ZDM8_9FIRM|nr:DMT family transporter [Natronincola ferrireducens]SDK13127.1 Threonine/homoserine efflux transporter RhtA [Natronincola ferrireducens]
MKTQLKADLMMLMVTAIWGSSYLFMKMGLNTIQEFNFIGLRFGIAFILSAIVFHKRLMKAEFKTVKYAFILGSILFSVFAAITLGLKTTTASNAGFLVSLTVIFVPILSAVFLKKIPEKRICLGACLAVLGIALLTLNSQFIINTGDLLCILGALFFAIHIIVTGKLTKDVDSIMLGVLQLGFTGGWGFILAFVLETPTLPNTSEAWLAVLALSILCSAIGFTLQTVAQKYTTPTHIGLIFSLEPVFTAVFAFIFIGEMLSIRGYIGAVIVLLGVVNAEIDFKNIFIKRRGEQANTW